MPKILHRVAQALKWCNISNETKFQTMTAKKRLRQQSARINR